MSILSNSSSSLKDPSKLFFEYPKTRRLILASYWTVVILALPLWWYSTSIERLSLPSARVQSQWEKPLRFLMHLNIDMKFDSEAAGYGNAIAVASDWEGLLNQRTTYEVERWAQLQAWVHPKTSGEHAIEKVVEGPGVYTVSIGDASETTIRDRHLSLTTSDFQTRYTSTLLVDMLSDLLAPDKPDRVVQYAPRYRLAFTLLNEDAAAGQAIHGWDIKDAITQNLSPLLQRLSILHNFTIESQVQFHAPLAFTPQLIQTDEGEAYGLMPEDLTVFVNSAEWTLSSSVSNDPVLHFILFVPSVTQRPLYILDADGSPSLSNAFLMPQWGGVVLFTPPTPDSLPLTRLSTSDLFPIMNLFKAQLLALLGVPSLPSSVRSIQPPSSPLTGWQLDALLRRRVLENVNQSTQTLDSIVELVNEIKNMPVGSGVKGDVEGALDALDTILSQPLTSNSRIQTLLHSSHALTLSSRAFFNPGMLALLYFPAEHKYAVYTPLFASVAVPLVAAAVRELRAWRQAKKEAARRKEKGKGRMADRTDEHETKE